MKVATYSSRIPQITAQAEARAALIVAKTAADIEAGAKVRAPVDTGHLKSSIQHRTTGTFEAEVTAGANYAGYVEWGTRHMGAQPFMVPAAEQARPGFEAAVRSLFS